MTAVGQPKFIYELRSVNFWTLTPDEQKAVRRKFTSFLLSLPEPVSFRIIRDSREVDVGGDIWETPYTRFFVTSEVPIDSSLVLLGTKYVRVSSLPSLAAASVLPRMFVDSESNFVQVYNVCNLSGSLYTGFLNSLYPIAHEVRVDIEPLDPYQAAVIAKKHSLSVGDRIISREVEGRARNELDDLEYRRALLASQLIAAGRDRLFALRLNVVLREGSLDGLREKRRMLRQVLVGQLGCEIDSPRFMSLPLYTGSGPGYATGRWFYATSSTLMNFFPFAGLDIIDPDGVTIGDNLQTGNKIVYDFYDKDNYNVAIMGSTGSGKSTFIKSVMSRLVYQDDGMLLYVFDAIVRPEYSRGPDGTEENSFAGLTKSYVHHYRKDEGAGLDPYSVLPEKRMATDFIASLAKIDSEPELYSELAQYEDKVNSVDELLNATRGQLQTRLSANLKPYLFLFRGKMDIYNRMVFVLYDIPDPKTRDAAAFLTLSAVWQKMRAMPASVRKALVVDEGWAFMERDPDTGKMYFPLAVKYVPEIARTARRHNVLFLVATQMVSDFFGVGDNIGPGRVLVDNCATRILLRQDHREAAETLKEKFALSEDETEFIVGASPGDGLLLANEGRVPFHNSLGSAEKAVFTTAPKEVSV
jgi:energy-coupling factor transporter ATP-binding protein EcfA2